MFPFDLLCWIITYNCLFCYFIGSFRVYSIQLVPVYFQAILYSVVCNKSILLFPSIFSPHGLCAIAVMHLIFYLCYKVHEILLLFFIKQSDIF